MVLLVPVPAVVVPPGVCVNIHVPVDGKPFRTTLPVVRVQVGWVTVPIEGAAGDSGGEFIRIFPDDGEIHPFALVTVYVKVPAARPVMVIVVPVPVVVVPPGDRVKVQVPVTGKLLNTTLPVDREHVGCVILSTDGDPGIGFTVASTPVLVWVVHPSIVAST